jgi:murein L,D-transpeptidase YcbB/YkuD
LRLIPWFLTIATSIGLLAAAWFSLLHGKSDISARQVADLTTGALQSTDQPQPPSPSPALTTLRTKLSAFSQKANRDDLAATVAFYRAPNGQLLWVTESGLSDKGRAVIAEIRRADDWGLRTSDFALPQLPAGDLSPEAQADAESKLTLAVLKYARYARGGRIGDPSRISKLLDRAPPLLPPKRVLADIAVADAPDAYLRGLHPKQEQFGKLRQLLLKLRRGDDGEKEIAFGESLQKAVPQLKLASTKPQSTKSAAEIDRILVNMERWRLMPVDLGALYVWNNVPEFLTRVVKSGKVINSDRIVAGQPAWPTPSFSADMTTIVFHPSWGVPDGIKRKELAPILRNSSGGGLLGLFTGTQSSQAVLQAQKLQVYYKGRPIDPNQVNWSSVNIAAYDFRQPPGPTNVLGAIKFLFPNKHDVYMHDTPDRSLFTRSFRGLSHGCMRVGDPRRLAEVLLAEDKGWSKDKIASLFNGGTQSVELSTRIPVHNTYFTAMVDYEGNLRTFGDLYGLDARVGRALLGRKVRFETRSYDNEVTAVQQEERRRQPRQSSTPTLADAISDIFSP